MPDWKENMKWHYSVENYFSSPKLHGNAFFQRSFTQKQIHSPANTAVKNLYHTAVITIISQHRGLGEWTLYISLPGYLLQKDIFDFADDQSCLFFFSRDVGLFFLCDINKSFLVVTTLFHNLFLFLSLNHNCSNNLNNIKCFKNTEAMNWGFYWGDISGWNLSNRCTYC